MKEYNCVNCGYTIKESFKFCPNCGKPCLFDTDEGNWVDDESRKIKVDDKLRTKTIFYEATEKLKSHWIDENSKSHKFVAGQGKIILRDFVSKIGKLAFFLGCDNLTSITIPNSVTEIGEKAFRGCSNLTSVTIPDSVTEIGEGAFYGCTSLTFITIPDSVRKIGEDAFSGCENLTSITIPGSVKKIGYRAFSGCSSLTSISGCSSLTSIVVDKNNPKYDSRDNCNAIIETETNTLIQGCQNTVIPDSVEIIGEGAFAGCTGLKSVIIPDSVTEIGEGAFRVCTGLTSITIPDSVTEIGRCAFLGCTGLKSIIIPDSVTIGFRAFEGCKSLTSITIPDSVTEIGRCAFSGCNNLSEETKELLQKKYNYDFS